MAANDTSPDEILKRYGLKDDHDIPLAEAALSLSVLWHPGLSLEKYTYHIQSLCRDVGETHAALIAAGAQNDLRTRLASIKQVMVDKNKYQGDAEFYDDIQNADMIQVIERRKGLPISLSILAIEAGRAQGWQVDGLNFPGHFLVRLEDSGQRLICDPFNNFQIMEAADLRALLKKIAGPNAELSANYYDPATNRDILIRLQNNLKLRQIEAEDYVSALKTVEAMQMIHPREYRLLFDAGILYARTNQPKAAIESLEQYIEKAPSAQDRHDAQMILQTLRGQLH